MSEKNAYILGTDYAELQRLGLQHQVWASEAQAGWKNAGFTQGMTLLDLGSGPGFCTKEMAYIVGSTGKVIAVDKSEAYINYLKEVVNLHKLNVDCIHSDFNDMQLIQESLDGMYCRWAMAWIPNPEEILAKVYNALKPGGKIVIQEYYDWSLHQTFPERPNLKKVIAGTLKSFEMGEGDINIGRRLGGILSDLGMRIISNRPMSKLARPGDLTWQWPKSFYEIYFPRVADMGYVTNDEVQQALIEVSELEEISESTLLCPILNEVIAVKI